MTSPPAPTTISEEQIPTPPDLRQSICHTTLALSLLLINVQDPFRSSIPEAPWHIVILIAMPGLAFFSWYLFYKKIQLWKKIPPATRSRITRTPRALKERAIAHLMMSLLAAGLTAIGYIGHLYAPLDERYNAIVSLVTQTLDGIVGVVAVAILSRTVRDLLTLRIAIKNG